MDRFGANIAFLRKKLGWSQQDLAKRLDVRRTTISNYEKGISMPPYKTLKKIASLFAVDIHELTANDLKNMRQVMHKSAKLRHEEDIDLEAAFSHDEAKTSQTNISWKKDSAQLPQREGREAKFEDPIFKEDLSLGEFHDIVDSDGLEAIVQKLENEIKKQRSRLDFLEGRLKFIKNIFAGAEKYGYSTEKYRPKDTARVSGKDVINE